MPKCQNRKQLLLEIPIEIDEEDFIIYGNFQRELEELREANNIC